MSDVVKNDVVKKAVHDKLVAKADDVDTSDVVLGTKYQTDKTELENKIPDINNLGAKTALTTVENKIPSVSNLVKIFLLYVFLDKEIAKKVSTCGQLMTIFYFTKLVDRKLTIF